MAKPRVLLADDHALVRAGIRSTLESDCEIVDYITQQLSAFVARGASVPKTASASR